MIEYAGIYLKKHSAQYARILNVSYTVVCGTTELHKDFVKNTKKRGPAGKSFGDFSPRYSLKLHHEWKI